MSEPIAGQPGNLRIEDFAQDLLPGAARIAEFLGTTERRVYYLAERRLLPIGRVGRSLFARRSELVTALSNATGKA
jgi:hypothetical protein